MLVELRERSQVTLPKPIIKQLGLKPGDTFDAVETSGVITLVPMALYPKPALSKAFKKGVADKTETESIAMAAIKDLFCSMSETGMSANAYAASKQKDLELE